MVARNSTGNSLVVPTTVQYLVHFFGSVPCLPDPHIHSHGCTCSQNPASPQYGAALLDSLNKICANVVGGQKDYNRFAKLFIWEAASLHTGEACAGVTHASIPVQSMTNTKVGALFARKRDTELRGSSSSQRCPGFCRENFLRCMLAIVPAIHE